MCFSSPKAPEPTPAPTIEPAPTPAPPPTPLPQESSARVASEADRRKKAIRATRYGILSTIKTSPLGIVGSGAGENKDKLGA